MSDSDRNTRRLIYRGTVQGVGFRMTVRRIAGRFAVAGFVRNLPDGTVELVARGAAEEIDGFLSAVAEAMAGYVRSVDETAPGPEEIPAGFEIRP